MDGKVSADEIQANMGKPELGADNIPVAIKKGAGNIADIKPLLSYSVNIDGIDLLLNLL